jgi:hypothetical protein
MYCLRLIFEDTFQRQVLWVMLNFKVQGKCLRLRLLILPRLKENEMYKYYLYVFVLGLRFKAYFLCHILGLKFNFKGFI